MADTSNILPHVRLNFEINNPDLEECWLDGYECSMADVNEDDNPYPESSKESHFWSEGWWAGFYGEEPLFILANNEAAIDVETPYAKSHSEESAANDSSWNNEVFKKWLVRVVKLTGIIVIAVAAYELSDLAA